MTINEIIKQSHNNAVKKGFYDCPNCDGKGIKGSFECPFCNGSGKSQKNIGELLMLVVSELGEALEAHRKGKRSVKFDVFENDGLCVWNFTKKDDIDYFKGNIKDTFEDELADAVIRICDMCGYLNIYLEKHIELKMRYNETREYKHGKAY